jgi:trehalose-6-phosphate synthase
MKIGVLSRRAPIGQHAQLGPTIEHVGGLTRVLPALAEFAHIDWTAVTPQTALGLPEHYSFAQVSGQNYRHQIDVCISGVDGLALNQSDWFCTHYIWPLLHDMAIPEIATADLEASLHSVKSVCDSMSANCIDFGNNGYLVNDFQLSQVPTSLKELDPEKTITFFLHTPWPKSVPNDDSAIRILEFLATGMLSADVIEFQTQSDVAAFEEFALAYMPAEVIGKELKVNPVSVQVQQLREQDWTQEAPINLETDDISYVHIARSDPIKNTLATIKSFTALVKSTDSPRRRFLDLFIVPSRQQWPEYQKLLADIENCVAVCNSQISSAHYLPIRLHTGNDYNRASQALARYDYLIACSVADGLNLVVKEGAFLNNRNGVIVSTERVGAMAEIGMFCIVATDASEAGITQALREAKDLDYESRTKMSAELKRHIHEFDSSNWAQTLVANFKVLEKV